MSDQRKELEVLMRLSGGSIRNLRMIREALYTAEETGILDFKIDIDTAIKIWRIVNSCDNVFADNVEAVMKRIRM